MNKKSAALYLGATALLLQACGGGGGDDGGGGGTGGGSPPPPPPAAAPTVSLDTNAVAARVGDKVTLTWSSQNATACTASGNWSGGKGMAGSEDVSLTTTGTASFTLTCTGAGGSASANKAVTTAPATMQLQIPGAPAPVDVAKGNCVATSDADFDVRCIATAADVPSKYDVFNSSSSGRVQGSITTTPTVTLGGACVAGFDRVQSRLAVDTTILDHFFSVTGSSISEVVYKPAFLNTLPGNTISEMSALLFQDNSNSDRMGYVMYAKVSGQPITFAGAGTIRADGTYDIVDCIGGAPAPAPSPSPSPTPTPTPTPLSCPAANGNAVDGLGLYGTTSYNISDTTPNATTPRSVGWGVRYNDPGSTGDSYTGSLRLTLWAVSKSYGGGSISGYKLFTGVPNFVGAGSRSATQIYNFYTFPDIVSSGTGRNPPAGKYCMVATLDEFSSSCTSDDGYCISDWIQFSGAGQFPN